MKKEIEIWKRILIKGEESNYEISNTSKVKNVKRNWFLETSVNNNGYVVLCLHHKNKKFTFTLHRQLGLYFIPNPENKPTINHKNGKKIDNRIKNLEWATHKEQTIHSFKVLGKTLKGISKEKSKITILQLHPVTNEIIKEWPSAKDASISLKIYAGNITNCAKGNYMTSKGFIWKYKVDNEDIESTIDRSKTFPLIEYKGEYKRIYEWAKIFNIRPAALWQRLNVYRMSFDKAISRPLVKGRIKGEPKRNTERYLFENKLT